MKSVKNSSVLRRLKNLAYRLSFFAEVLLLLLGYVFLSPDNCETGLRLCARMTGLFTDVDLLSIVPFVRKVVPPLILYWAVVFVFGLFRPLSIRRFRLWGIWVLLGITCWFLPCSLEEFSRYYDAFYASVTLVFVAGLIASKLYEYSRNGGATALALIFFVVIGTVLYEMLASIGVFKFHAERWLRPEQILDSMFGVIDKQKDIADIASLQNRVFYCFYYLFHALLAFFGGYVIIGFVSKAAVNMMLLRFSRTPDSVFWGISPEAIALAQSLKKERCEECVFVVPDIKSVEGSDLDQLTGEGFLWVAEGHGTLPLLARRVKKHFFITSSASANVELATRLSKAAENEPDVYVCIDDETDDSRLFRWANGTDIREKMNVHIIRETSLVADILLRDHPMLKAPGVKAGNGHVTMEPPNCGNTFRLLQIGFGAQGRMLLNRTICDVAPCPCPVDGRSKCSGANFSAVVVDCNKAAFDLYNVRSPEVSMRYAVQFKKFDVRRKAFYDWLINEISKMNYTRIVVATGDDELNLFVSDFIVRNYRERADRNQLKDLREILFVRVRHPEKYAGFLPRTGNADFQKGQAQLCNDELCFMPFGSDQEIYSCQGIVDFDIDAIAKKINAYYAGTADVRAAWRKASFFDRESSRGSAMGLWNICRIAVGKEPSGEKDLKRWKASVCTAWKDVKCNKDDIRDRLADAEHLRWMAYHYVRGIKKWNPESQPEIVGRLTDKFDEDLKSEIEELLEKQKLGDKAVESYNAERWDAFRIKANQLEYANRHAALIPTDHLFRLDVYLDMKSFEKRASKIFTLYAEELGKHWNEVIKSDGHLSETSFEGNKALCALNRCVFAYMDIGKECKSLMFARAKNEILNLLTEFAANVVALMEHGSAANDSGFQHDAASDKKTQKAMDEQLDDLLNCLLHSANVSLTGVKWYELMFNRRAGASLKKVKASLEKFKRSPGVKVGFRTLGNLVRNDIDIVERVPDHLEIREEDGAGGVKENLTCAC